METTEDHVVADVGPKAASVVEESISMPASQDPFGFSAAEDVSLSSSEWLGEAG